MISFFTFIFFICNKIINNVQVEIILFNLKKIYYLYFYFFEHNTKIIF